MRLNKKGFTLVELLAVVVILGIIMTVSIPAVSKWINRSKDSSKDAQEKTLLLAGQAYAQGNSKILPKAIGETKFIKAEDLKKANYLKEDLKDADKKDCMKDSVVRIYKYDKNGYSYTAYLYCEGDEVPEKITGVSPIIGISFTGDYSKDDVLQDVSKAGFRVTIDGNKKDGKNLGIDGYTYSISVKYAGTGEVVEIFNSGSLNAGGKEKLVIEKSLGDYTKITTLSEFMVTVEAYNRDGGYKKETANSKYSDSTPPVCGDIEGQAGANQWFNTPHTSTISVKCSDEANGSGCTKEVFTKSWNTEVEDDYIEIKDNAGNTTKCKVRVHHDWTRPSLTVTAFKRNSDGSKGAQVASITANNASPTVTLSSYTGDYGTNHWLNYANFKDGIYYEITVSDNIHINSGHWYYNNTKITDFNSSTLNNMNTGSTKTFTKTDNKTAVTLTGEGIRRAKYVVKDLANHTVTVNIQANIDVTAPDCTSSGGSSAWTNNKRTLKGTCTDSISKCQGNITKDFTEEQNSTTRSPGTVYDNAGNSTNCPGNQTVKIDKTAPYCTYEKTITNHPDGVQAKLYCGDNLSGVASCPCKNAQHTGEYAQLTGGCVAGTAMKSSRSFTVTDAAGNSGGCTIPVESYTASDFRSRNCKSCNACAAAGQDCTEWTFVRSHGEYENASYTGNTSKTECSATGGTALADYYCRDYTRSCSYRTNCNSCGCKSYTSWSAFNDVWTDSPCTDTDTLNCRFRTQYR